MELLEAIKQRHSVRAYIEKPIEKQKTEILEKEVTVCNKKK